MRCWRRSQRLSYQSSESETRQAAQPQRQFSTSRCLVAVLIAETARAARAPLVIAHGTSQTIPGITWVRPANMLSELFAVNFGWTGLSALRIVEAGSLKGRVVRCGAPRHRDHVHSVPIGGQHELVGQPDAMLPQGGEELAVIGRHLR